MRAVKWMSTSLDELDVQERVSCNEEVVLGLSGDEAWVEASRCLRCPTPSCQEGCPNDNPIREILEAISEGRLDDAVELNWQTNGLPACTGRVCPWEEQCEGFCVLNNRRAPLRVGAIERYLADWALDHLDDVNLGVPEKTYPQKVAVIGAGPGGMAAAHFLRRFGYPVTIFDAWDRPGGVMSYGIPEFVLPQNIIDKEMLRLRRMGVEFQFGIRIGKDVALDELMNRFEAAFIATGTNRARGLDTPGSELQGVVTAKDFLLAYSQRVGSSAAAQENGHSNSSQILEMCQDATVLVVGAGNTAMDAARAAVRLGAKNVKIVYRRSAAQSPSRDVEVEHAKNEGVEFQYLVNPVRFLGSDGKLERVELIKMELGKKDSSGRPRPTAVEGSEFTMPADVIVLALGYNPEDDVVNNTEGLQRDSWGLFMVDPDTMATTREGVFAGGDCVSGPKTVSAATAQGRRAAEGIHRYLRRKSRMSLEKQPDLG